MNADAKPLRRWEYLAISVGDLDRAHLPLLLDEDVVGALDVAGSDGWEFVQFGRGIARVGSVMVEAHCALLKREVQS